MRHDTPSPPLFYFFVVHVLSISRFALLFIISVRFAFLFLRGSFSYFFDVLLFLGRFDLFFLPPHFSPRPLSPPTPLRGTLQGNRHHKKNASVLPRGRGTLGTFSSPWLYITCQYLRANSSSQEVWDKTAATPPAVDISTVPILYLKHLPQPSYRTL